MTEPLAARLAELRIEPDELAAIVRRTPEEVEGWLKAKTLGGEAAVLLRFLADDHVANLAVERVRQRRTESFLGRGQTEWPSPPEPVLDGEGWK